jgi:hypothetical protein
LLGVYDKLKYILQHVGWRNGDNTNSMYKVLGNVEYAYIVVDINLVCYKYTGYILTVLPQLIVPMCQVLVRSFPRDVKHQYTCVCSVQVLATQQSIQ